MLEQLKTQSQNKNNKKRISVYSSVVKLLDSMHETQVEGLVKDLGKRGNKNRKTWTSKSVIKYLNVPLFYKSLVNLPKLGQY